MAFQKYFDISYFLRLVLQHAKMFQSAPVKLVPTSNKSTLKLACKTSLEAKSFSRNINLLFPILGLQLHQCLSSNYSTNFKRQQVSDTSLAWLAFVALTTSTITTHLTKNKGKILEALLKNLIAFHKTHETRCNKPPKALSLNKALNRLTLLAGLLTGLFLAPFFALGFHWVNPFKSSLIGYFLLNQCLFNATGCMNSTSEIGNVLLKTIVYFGNLVVWYFAINGQVFIATAIHIICPIMMINCIKITRKR